MQRHVETSLLQAKIRQFDSYAFLVKDLSLVRINLTEDSGGPSLSSVLSGLDELTSWIVYDENLVVIEKRSQDDKDKAESTITTLVRHVQTSGELQRDIHFNSRLQFWSSELNYIDYVIPLGSGKRPNGILELRFSLQEIVDKSKSSIQIILIYVALYGVVLLGAGYFLLLRNVINPAKKLLNATQSVIHGDYSTHLDELGPVEIQSLAKSFNVMLDSLLVSRQETFQHIDALEKTNRELRSARNELVQREKMASVGHLAAGIAHEIGNPLAALIGYLEILKNRLKDFDDKDLIRRSSVEAERIDVLVRELLNFSRPQNLDNTECVNIVDEFSKCSELLRNQGAFKQIALVEDFSESPLPAIRINSNKLAQVFVNILMNAVQACGENGKITVRAGSEDNRVWISISDNGCGMNEKNLSSIFDPFFTTKEPGIGTGLGLSICQRIIDEAGGSISVSSEPGHGSSFLVSFPPC